MLDILTMTFLPLVIELALTQQFLQREVATRLYLFFHQCS